MQGEGGGGEYARSFVRVLIVILILVKVSVDRVTESQRVTFTTEDAR